MKHLTIEVRYIETSQFVCTNSLASAVQNTTNQPPSCNVSEEEKAKVLKDAERAVVCRIPQDLETKVFGEENFQKLIVVKDSATRAGTAMGNLITMTTATENSVAIHELMHTFGYADGYDFYNACEADKKCPGLINRTYANLAVFEDAPPYGSDAAARLRHSPQIPWYGLIKPSVLITTGSNLGTPGPNVIGLYRASNCNLATVKIKLWKPGNEKTIMETTTISTVPRYFWKRISDLLGEDLDLTPWGDWLSNPEDSHNHESGTN